MGLVDHHEDVLGVVQQTEGVGLAQGLVVRARGVARVVGVGGVAVLLDHRHHDAGAGLAEQVLDLTGVAADADGIAGERGGVAELALQVLAIGDEHDLEAP